ncbi:hypothetical protein DBR06_SOUSAS1710132, partial [Sousa chinensis]
EDIIEELETDNSLLGLKIGAFRKGCIKEKSKHTEQVEVMAGITRNIQSLEDSSKHIRYQVPATATGFKMHQKKKRR